MYPLRSAAVVTLGVFAFVTVFAAKAVAGCVEVPGKRPASFHLDDLPGLRGAAYRPATVMLVSDDEGRPSIVGMWEFRFVSQGNTVYGIPDGAQLDFGYAQWHDDGTEITNSGQRDPATSSFCLGVWKSVGGRRYRLNHFGVSWDNTGQFCVPPVGSTSCLVGTANIRQQVTLSHTGDSYTGTLSIDQYDTGGTLLVHLGGTVEARRIKP